jgi:hypothetical protein
MSLTLAGSPLVPKAHAQKTETCFAWVICSKDEADPNVDQTVKPSPKFNKLPEKTQKFFSKQCFSKHYDFTIRRDLCKDLFLGYAWKDPKTNWTVQGAIDPVNVVNNGVKKLAGGWVEEGLQGLARAEADGVQWLIESVVDAIGANTEPAITPGYVTQLNNVFSWGIVLAMLAFGWGWLKATFQGSIADAVLSFGFLVRFFFFGTLALVFTFWVLSIVDQGLTPAFMQEVAKSNTQALKNMSKVDFTKGVSGVVIPFILPVLYLIPALIGGFLMAVELIIRMLMILILVPVVVLALAMGPSNSAWAKEKLQENLQRLLGWILMPLILAIVLSIAFGMLQQTQHATGKTWPVGVVAAILMIASPIITWEISRGITGHGFGAASVYRSIKK